MTTATITPDSSAVTQRDFVLGVILSSGFRANADGWLYPQGNKPLVRVAVTGDAYRMERRRTPLAVWMQIVDAGIGDFDRAAFESWADNWPLTAQL